MYEIPKQSNTGNDLILPLACCDTVATKLPTSFDKIIPMHGGQKPRQVAMLVLELCKAFSTFSILTCSAGSCGIPKTTTAAGPIW